jgi:hypothetical protein
VIGKERSVPMLRLDERVGTDRSLLGRSEFLSCRVRFPLFYDNMKMDR